VRESFDIWGDHGKYPDDYVPDFKIALIELRRQCLPLVRKLLHITGILLGLKNEQFFTNCAKHLEDSNIPNQSMFRTLWYPPAEIDLKPGTLRCVEHTDYGIITLLFQDLMGGLQVKKIPILTKESFKFI